MVFQARDGGEYKFSLSHPFQKAFKPLLCVFSKEKPPRAQGRWDLEPHGVNGAVGSQAGALPGLLRISQQCHMLQLYPSNRRRWWRRQQQQQQQICPQCTTVLFCCDEIHMAYGCKVTILRADRNGIFHVPDFTSLSETILVVNRGFLILLRSKGWEFLYTF